jgi:hypothetical protein
MKTPTLGEIKKMYPIGTVVKSLYHEGNPILKIDSDIFVNCRKDAIHVEAENSALLAVVYENGEFAEIISYQEEPKDTKKKKVKEYLRTEILKTLR